MSRQAIIGSASAIIVVIGVLAFFVFQEEPVCPYMDTPRVFHDADRDGVQDAGEEPLPDVVVVLNAGGLHTNRVTGPDGEAPFTIEIPCQGETVITVSPILPDGMTYTTANSATVRLRDASIVEAEPLVFGLARR